jgi:WD40 repeat protein
MQRPLSRPAVGCALFLVAAASLEAPGQPVVAPPPRPVLAPRLPLPPGAAARIGRPRLRFPAAVINIAFAPSGTTFVSTGMAPQNGSPTDRLVVLWDAATGQEIREFRGHQFGAEAVAFSADGKFLATGGRDRTVRIWDVRTGAEVRKCTGHTDTILAVAFSPDGRQIASEGNDSTIRLWDTGTGGEVKRIGGHQSRGTSNLRYSPDGKLLAFVGADFALRLWSPETGAEVKRMPGPARDSESLDFSPDGKQIAAISEDGKLWVWEVATGKELVRVQAHGRAARKDDPDGITVRFSPVQPLIATGGGDGLIRFWDASGKLLRTAGGHPGNNVSEISFSADGAILASAGHDGTVRLWDVATARELPQSGGQAALVALSRDGKRLATSTGEPLVRFWEPATGKELLPPVPLGAPVAAMDFAAGGRTLVVSNSVDQLQFWDVPAGKLTATIGAKTSAPTTRLAVGPGGRSAATTNGANVRLWGTEPGQQGPVRSQVFPGLERVPPIRAMSFCPDESRLAVVAGDGRAHLLDFPSGQELFAVPQNGAVLGAALDWSPDGRSFATVGVSDGSLRIWEVASRRERTPAIALSETGAAAAFSPDGRILAVGGVSGSLQLWDVRAGKLLAARPAHAGAVNYLAFTPDGRLLVSASTDAIIPVPKGSDARVVGEDTALVWDVAELVKEVPAVPKPAAGEVGGLWEALKGRTP